MRLLILLSCLGAAVFPHKAQVIQPYFFSQNAWMSDTLGDYNHCYGEPKGLACKLWGKIHYNNNWNKVKLSGVKMIRFGGEHADENMPTRRQYLQMVDSARAKGIEPLLQVPYNNNFYTCDTAASLVRFINVTMKRHVKFWTIGNEPDLPPPNGYGYYTASPIADYIKQFSVKMKAVDSSIITIGPELTYYDDRHKLITELTTPGGYYDITGKVPGHSYYYLDVISYHSYPFGGNQTRDELITNLRDPWHISATLEVLKGRLDSCNTVHRRFGPNALKMALTETNMNYKNSPDPELGAHSFIGGQFWCELMGVGMEKGLAFISFWSVVEASLGYIDEATGKLWPTFYHYKLMADHFKGYYYKSEVPETIKDLKIVAAADSNFITVMVLNQKNKGANYKFSLLMGNSKITGEKDPAFRIKNIRYLKSTLIYKDVIEDESSLLLVFSITGKLVKKYSYKKSEGSNAVPRLSKDLISPIVITVGPDMNVSAGKEVPLTAVTNNKNADIKWFAEDSEVPLNIKSQNILNVIPQKNTRYRVKVTCDGYNIESELKVSLK